MSLSLLSRWASLGLLIVGAKVSLANNAQLRASTYYDPTCTANVTIFDTTTVISSTNVPVTHYVDVTVNHVVDVTSTETCTVSTSTTTTLHYTESTTNTLHYTESTTNTLHYTESTTTTLHFTELVTQTNSATITNTATTTATVPATITTYTTTTVLSTKVDPCPTTCSISAGTVNLYFWPTDRPYTYPSTYVNTALGYTFTYPSVYMLIPTAVGTNSVSGRVGPSTTNWMLPLNLNEVSTIVDGTLTRQLTLSDIGTDCAQTADPTAIATLVDSRCDPILAAPKQVTSWAYPCNACGRFGLFDPPYAIPTLTGGLIGTTVPPSVTVTVTPPPTSPPPVGTLFVVYYSNGKAMATATILSTGITGSMTSTVFVDPTASADPADPAASSSAAAASSSAAVSTRASATATGSALPTTTSKASTSNSPSTSLTSVASTSPSSSPTQVATASASRATGGFAWAMLCILIAVYLL